MVFSERSRRLRVRNRNKTISLLIRKPIWVPKTEKQVHGLPGKQGIQQQQKRDEKKIATPKLHRHKINGERKNAV